MKSFIVCLVCAGLALGVARGQDVPEVAKDQVPKRPDIDGKTLAQPFDKKAFVARLESKFSHINSFAYAYHDPRNVYHWAYCWREMGDAYYSEIICDPIHLSFAFDGKRTSTLRQGGDIYVKNGENKEAAEPKKWYSPLDLYAFLSIDDQFLCAKALRPDAPLWKDLAGRIDYAGTVTFLNHDCIVLRFWGSYDQRNRKPADYDVYFDAQSLLPLGWQAYDSDKLMIEELTFMGQNPYPDKAGAGLFAYAPCYNITQYQDPGTLAAQPSGRVIKYWKAYRHETFDDVEINSLAPEDLQLDYSLAEGIIDEDTHKAVRFPR